MKRESALSSRLVAMEYSFSPFLTLRPSWFHAYIPATRVASGFCRAISKMFPKL